MDKLCFVLLMLSLFVACGESGNKSQQANSNNLFNDKTRLENINQYLTEKDMDIIKGHIRRQGWKMQLSSNGYFYEIYDEGKAPKITDGNEVEYEYIISLLNGNVLYKFDEPKTFIVSGSEEISGLHYAIKHVGCGGSAKFIFPPQLAYGLMGDMNKVPARSIVVYDVKVTNVK